MGWRARSEVALLWEGKICLLFSHSVNHRNQRVFTTFGLLDHSLSLPSAVRRENGVENWREGFSVNILREIKNSSKNLVCSQPLDFLYENGEAPRD